MVVIIFEDFEKVPIYMSWDLAIVYYYSVGLFEFDLFGGFGSFY